MVEEFEKRLVGQPNSSLLWIKYMSTVLKHFDLNKARSIAERALKTISFREEQEKVNLYIAYLNMENMCGSAESLKKVFDRSIIYCDPRTMFLQLAKIYSHGEKWGEAEETYKIIIKKFGESCKVWVEYAEFLYPRDVGSARKLLAQSLAKLPKRKRIVYSLFFKITVYR